MIQNAPCSNAECQAKSLVELTGLRSCFADNESRFIKAMTANFQLAGMNGESALRQFSLVEPMLVEELEIMGCSPSIVQALLGSGSQQRMNATAMYLGHRSALATLAQFKDCVQNYGSQSVATTVAQEIQALHESVQRKLIALQQAVFSFSKNSYGAPGAPFHMLEGIQTFEQSWGKTQLKMLRSSDEGQNVLTLPLQNANILAAKRCVIHATNELLTVQITERTAFFNDYPGTAQLHATGQMKSTELMLADRTATWPMMMGLSAITIDTKESGLCPDIRCLRPEARVLSSKMAENSLEVDLEKACAYTSKPHTQDPNPWWWHLKV